MATQKYIDKQLIKLQSKNANTRYDACESLKVADSIPPEAIKALQNALSDPNADVVDAAQRALKVHLPSEDTRKSDNPQKVEDEPKIQLVQKQATAKPVTSVWPYIIMFAILTAILLFLLNAIEWNELCVWPLFILYIGLVGGMISGYFKETTANEKAIANHNALIDAREKYDAIRKQVNIPETAKEITYYKSSPNSPVKLANSKNQVYIWKSEGNISFFPCSPSDINSISVDDLKIYTIPVSQIEYFSKRGEIFRENKISGGGGGGSSIGGAVAGGLIAGEAGAVIGSRKKVNEIKSELITHDTRETFLNYFDNNERHSLFFDVNAYQIFNDWIPEKEFSIVNAIKSSEIIKTQINTENNQSVTDQLRELAKLRDDGIITENEFNEKKKQLLDKIV